MGILQRLNTAWKLAKDKKDFTPISEILGESFSPKSKFSTTNSYLQTPKMITWVSIACSLLGESTAMTNGDVYDKNNKLVEGKPINNLLKNPNFIQDDFEFNEGIVWYLLLAGNCYIYKNEMNGRNEPKDLWFVRPDVMKPMVKNGILTGYKYEDGTKEEYFSVDEIIHLKLFNPISPYVGLGKIQFNEVLYNTEYAAQVYTWHFFDNRAEPAGALCTKENLNDDVIFRLRKEWESRYKGYQKAHRLAILEGGLEYKNIGLSQKDMDYVNLRKFSREQILGIFKIPPVKAGIFEYANYANAREQDNIYNKEALKPLLIRIQKAFTKQLIKPINPDWAYYFDEVIKKDEELNVNLATRTVGSGLMTPNQARERYLDEPKELKNPALDQYYMAANLFPLGESPPSEPVKSIEGKKKTPAEARLQRALYRVSLRTRSSAGRRFLDAAQDFFRKQEKEILKQIDSFKSMGDTKAITDSIFDDSMWDKELQKAMKAGHTSVIMRSIEDANMLLEVATPNGTDTPRVADGIGKLATRVTGINKTTKGLLDKTLKEGMNQGESVPALKKRVTKVFSDAKGYRAEMIARTESARAWDMGAINSYEDFGSKYIDVIGCECSHYPCNATNVPIGEARNLEFHPNHTGAIVPHFT